MKHDSDVDELRRVCVALSDLLGDTAEVVERRPPSTSVDAVIRAGRFLFVVETKGSGNAGPVALATRRARVAAAHLGEAVPLVVVPYMGDVGRQLCEEEGVAWLDLSGNARIVADGLRVVVTGKPNRFKQRGRPANAFAPKSARIARWLLLHLDQKATQTEIAKATDMSPGFTSRIVGRLAEEGFVSKDADGRLRVGDPDLLLDAWRERYDFHRHRTLRGHIATRSSEALMANLAVELRRRDIDHAATGLAAAWLFSRFAAFRIVTLYLATRPTGDLLDSLGFREDPRGANTWLVVPKDDGVFYGAKMVDGVRCVHPVQVYLDLKGHPERAEEAAANLRKSHLLWRGDA